jgi:hypothetical protein
MIRWSGPVVTMVDMLLATAVALLALAVLVEPPGKPKAAEDPSRQEMTAYLFWDDASDVDIDLWCRAPGDRPVGYSSRTSAHADLLRDDLGFRDDSSGRNFEEVHFRGLVAGEYLCNAHWYGSFNAPAVPVKLVVTQYGGDVTRTIVTRAGILRRQGEELTMARWSLDAALGFVHGSVNDLPLSLRSAGT